MNIKPRTYLTGAALLIAASAVAQQTPFQQFEEIFKAGKIKGASGAVVNKAVIIGFTDNCPHIKQAFGPMAINMAKKLPDDSAIVVLCDYKDEIVKKYLGGKDMPKGIIPIQTTWKDMDRVNIFTGGEWVFWSVGANAKLTVTTGLKVDNVAIQNGLGLDAGQKILELMGSSAKLKDIVPDSVLKHLAKSSQSGCVMNPKPDKTQSSNMAAGRPFTL